MDEATSHVAFDEPCTVEPQFSFGHVSQTFDSIYFVHEVNDYDGNPNTGAVSRWKIKSSPFLQLDQDPSNEMYDNSTTMRGTSITKEEVRWSIISFVKTLINLMYERSKIFTKSQM